MESCRQLGRDNRRVAVEQHLARKQGPRRQFRVFPGRRRDQRAGALELFEDREAQPVLGQLLNGECELDGRRRSGQTDEQNRNHRSLPGSLQLPIIIIRAMTH